MSKLTSLPSSIQWLFRPPNCFPVESLLESEMLMHNIAEDGRVSMVANLIIA